MIKKLLITASCLTALTFSMPCAATNFTADTETNIDIFDYESLSSSVASMTQYLHNYGFIAIRGVPEYVETKAPLIKMARAFAAQSPEEKAKCTPKDSFSTGWSDGIEVFNGKKDSYKGSYYAVIGEEAEKALPNTWPPETWEHATAFKDAYLALATMIFETGKEILPLLGLDFDNLSGKGRMLHYGAIPEGEDDGNPNWCSVHRDHGLFTGLIPATYVKDGQIVPKPAGAGLYIREKEIKAPDDVMLFQVGEMIDLVTGQGIIATPHHVQKAFDGHERFTMALFFNIDPEHQLFSTSVDDEYKGRFTQGMTYAEWCAASYDRYK